jgi:hypothetical protein
MHHLSTENIPLKLRCQGLKSALEKRQRGKALQFDIPPPEKGDAVFYCLRKVAQAHDLQRQKDEAIQLAKVSKRKKRFAGSK